MIKRQMYDNPVVMPSLVDYWFGNLDAADEARLEFELMGRGESFRWMADPATGIHMLVERGAMRAVVSDEFLARAAAKQLKAREYTLPCGGDVVCTIAAGDDLLVVRLEARLDGVEQLDLLMLDNHGGGPERTRGIPFDPASGYVALASRVRDLRGQPATTCSMQLLAVYDTGERILGQYGFHFRPWRSC